MQLCRSGVSAANSGFRIRGKVPLPQSHSSQRRDSYKFMIVSAVGAGVAPLRRRLLDSGLFMNKSLAQILMPSGCVGQQLQWMPAKLFNDT